MKKYAPSLIFLLLLGCALFLTHHWILKPKNSAQALLNECRTIRPNPAIRFRDRYLTEEEFNTQKPIKLHLNEKLLIPWRLVQGEILSAAASPISMIQSGDVVATAQGLSCSFTPVAIGRATITLYYGAQGNMYKKIIINNTY